MQIHISKLGKVCYQSNSKSNNIEKIIATKPGQNCMNVSLFDDVFNLIVRTLNFDTLLSQSQTKQHLEQAGN